MSEDPRTLEQQAYDFLSENQHDKAFKSFRGAGETYKQKGEHRQAAICFASAASSWALKLGEKTFYHAAHAYESAAKEAEKDKDLKYAALLYKHAAVYYEKDMEFLNFSECFFRSKECYRKFLAVSLVSPEKAYSLTPSEGDKGARGYLKRFISWVGLTFSSLIWGHGERPARTLFTGLALIFISAIFHSQGELIKDGVIFKPTFLQSLYFSVITFTTVGFGDITPVGFAKITTLVEAFSGVFITSLFIVGLSRKYLRF